MPRVGLKSADVVLAAAEMADERGIAAVSLAAVADRLGVKPPALYKHIESIDDLRRRIATLAMTELADGLRDDLQGKAGSDALRAVFRSVQAYISRHPGRYSATTGVNFRGDDDPFLIAGARVIESLQPALSGYGLSDDASLHAIRTLRCAIHGFALLQASDGFQWNADLDRSVEWMIQFFDAGLSGMA